ncbi:MAG: 50S ribosomal protein L15 [Patescibacteria group bacterium]|nr:50S ribosomal protein L15 [Patescibacteria group bacterium]
MQIHELKKTTKKQRKRVGRGGKKGTYSGAGMKGQKSRAGYSKRATFEGGKSTIVARTKKVRGFKSLKVGFQVVNLDLIEKKFNNGDEVNPETLKKVGAVKKVYQPIKILSVGKISKKLTFKDLTFSEVAKKKIEKAGGSIE